MITFDEEMNKLSPERRAKIEAKTQELLQEVQILNEIRRRLGLPHKEQLSTVSNSDDIQQHLTLEKLTSIIDELGGEWELTLKFPDRQRIKLTKSDDLIR